MIATERPISHFTFTTLFYVSEESIKRNLDLIRELLLEVESTSAGYGDRLVSKGYTEEEIGYHAWLAIDAGLAGGSEVTTLGSATPEGLVTNLTWNGHEFLDAARDDTNWSRAMDLVKSKGGNVTLEILKALLISILRGSFGV